MQVMAKKAAFIPFMQQQSNVNTKHLAYNLMHIQLKISGNTQKCSSLANQTKSTSKASGMQATPEQKHRECKYYATRHPNITTAFQQ